MEGNYLITTDGWFIAPNGRQYKSAWGKIEIIKDSMLGLETNRNSTNWYAKIGGEERYVIVAGCQIHYAVRCDEVPNIDKSMDWTVGDNGLKTFEAPTKIYLAQ